MLHLRSQRTFKKPSTHDQDGNLGGASQHRLQDPLGPLRWKIHVQQKRPDLVRVLGKESFGLGTTGGRKRPVFSPLQHMAEEAQKRSLIIGE